MSAKNPTILKTATDIFNSQNIIAFVGNPGSGKTVVGTLLKDAMFDHFGRKHKDEFNVNLLKGSDVLEETERYLFTQKTFPPETPPGTQSELAFEISRKGSLGKKIVIRIRDLSGEDFTKVFLGDDVSPKIRVNAILSDKEKTEPYGSMSFLIFAKLYVILIDCEEFSNWKSVQTRQSQMLNSILGFKEELGETEKGQFTTPLAIILTKTDVLPNGIEGSAEEMIEKYLPQFYQTLSSVHAGKRNFFTMHVAGYGASQQEQQIDPTLIKKLRDPINYSSGEYVKLILWFIETLS